VKPAAWYLNVVPRTLRAFVPALARPDDAFAARWLSADEYALYRRMDRRDRDHGCQVARRVLARAPQVRAAVVRAALLHDVGKSAAPYRAWERIAVHLYRPAAAAAEQSASGCLARAWQWHALHAERGAAMILAVGGDPEVAELVRRHHDPSGPAGADLIRAADART
jgi:putative nucleotidyltransferase with HDIG domain